VTSRCFQFWKPEEKIITFYSLFSTSLIISFLHKRRKEGNKRKRKESNTTPDSSSAFIFRNERYLTV
jgi:hypothetical protein